MRNISSHSSLPQGSSQSSSYQTNSQDRTLFTLRVISTILSVGWTIIVILNYKILVNEDQNNSIELAKREARSNFNKDLAFRAWGTDHGGVYVPISDETPPNPALSHLKERDITTPSGKKLTLMNPAYMLRQMMGKYDQLYGIKGRITSFKYLNPSNKPDEWEAEGLSKFEKGEKEVFEFSLIKNEPYLRLMQPFITKQGCLLCHGFQGYKEGDIQGGISVSVPFKPFLEDHFKGVNNYRISFGIMWMIGFLGIANFYWILARQLHKQRIAEIELRNKHFELIESHKEFTRMATISSHHFLEPARRIISFVRQIKSKLDSKDFKQGGQDPSIDQTKLNDIDISFELNFLEQGGVQLYALIRDMERYITAIEPKGKFEELNMEEIIEGGKNKFTDQFKELNIQLKVLSPLPTIYFDQARMKEIINELIENVIQHGLPNQKGKQSIIEVSGSKTDKSSPPGREKKDPTKQGEAGEIYSQLRIEDNGPGIEQQYHNRLFVIFERLKPYQVNQTGSGLAIIRRMVESAQGRVWIENSKFGGTSVVIELPEPPQKVINDKDPKGSDKDQFSIEPNHKRSHHLNKPS